MILRHLWAAWAAPLLMAIGILAAELTSMGLAQETQTSQAPQLPPLPQQPVHFKSLDGTTELTAYLSRPEGDQPRPALVLMHGCSGLLNDKGIAFGTYRAWTRALLGRDYVVLVVDSAGSRGFGQTCSAGPNRLVMWRDRPKDAYAALQYLQAQPFVRADHIGLMGWSQGGGAVLLTINEHSIGRPQYLAQDFRTAVAFYPGACSERLQSKPFTTVDPQGWTSAIPLLVLMGEADTWTPYPPCADFLNAAKARGNAIELKSYPGVFHAFDAPNLPQRELPQYRTPDGAIPIIATDKEARADAFARVLGFLNNQLRSN